MLAHGPQLDYAVAPAPDHAAGVYETLLVVNGHARQARRHLERMRTSVGALYGIALPDGIETQLARAAAGHALARLRIEITPRGSARPVVTFVAAAIERAIVLPAAEVALASVQVAGFAGAHKLLDRSWLEQIERLAGADVRPLLVSRAGALLETTRANVFLVRDGVLATPPLDGSILSGTVRAALLDHARGLGIDARELPLTLADLAQADVVLLTGSVRLLERARARDGRRSAQVVARLSDALDTEAFA